MILPLEKMYKFRESVFSLAALQQNSVRGLMVHLEERAGSFHGQEFDPPPPVQTRNPTPFRRPTYPQSGGGCRLGCPAFLLPPFLPPPESETLGPVQRGKADLPTAPGWGRPIPTTGIAGTKGPPLRQAKGGRSHIQGRVPFQDRWGKGQNHHTSAPKPSPLIFRS